MNKKRFGINTIISIALSCVTTVFILAIALVLFYSYSTSMRENITNSTKEIVRQVNNNLDYYISDIMRVADYVRNMGRTSSNYTTHEIQQRMETLLDSRADLVRLSIFDLQGNVIASTAPTVEMKSDDIVNLLWFERASKGEGNFFFTGPHIQKLSPHQNETVISYSQLINYGDISRGFTQQAVLLIDLNFTAIQDLSQSATLSKSGYIYFITNDNDIVYHPKMAEIEAGTFEEDITGVKEQIFGLYINTFDGRERLSSIETVNYCRWRIVGVAYLDELLSTLNQFISTMMVMMILAVTLAIIISQLIADRVTSPMRQLEVIMRQVQKGDFSTPTIVKGSVEVVSLSHSFNIMIIRIRKLMEEIKNVEKLKRKGELDALQAKINPHFLYNTLDSVVWMAEQGDTQGVIKMITSLARLFRISIGKGHDIITIQEELAHVQSYLEIQQMRYRDKFDFTIDIPEELKNYPTIKLLVQPIVENSVYHGMKYLQEPGHINITVKEKDEETILIEVKDNGIGMDEETRANLLNPANPKKHQSDGNGIGVINVDQRIKLYYGMEFGLSVESELDEGTTVTLAIKKDSPIEPVVIKTK